MKKEDLIISVGGSLVCPNEINTDFLRRFRDLILKQINKKRFFIYVGGGKTARKYQAALSEFSASSDEKDWAGIWASRLNAYLVKNAFKDYCYPEIITDPTKKIKLEYNILVAAGWKPGWSTDYDAVLLAKNFGLKKIINLTNIDYVYEKDPKKFPQAKPFKKIDWEKFRKIVGLKWSPGLSMPFDPVAAKIAQKLKINVIIINGKELKRLGNFLNNKPFIGTIIS